MRPKSLVLIAAAVLATAILSVLYWKHLNTPPILRHGVAHQLPYTWDSYVRPDLEFTMEPMSNVIAKVNALIRGVSSNTVSEAIKLNTSPTRIIKVNSDSSLAPHMDKLIADFRENEKEMCRRGAEGFESTPFTGSLDGYHSLWCTLAGPGNGGLSWEAEKDALHVARAPRTMECRPYYVAKGLENLVKASSIRVDCEPIVSALIDATGIHSWSIMLPEGPNAWTSEVRYDKVFKYVPTLNVILALATPEEHAEAEKKLRASGLWVEPQPKKEDR